MEGDKALVSRVLSGDLQAFRMLIKQNERLVAHMIGRVIRDREEAEELCQDVFLKVYEKLSGFNFQSRLSTWIATIAYRIALNHLKKKKIPLSDLPEEEETRTFFIDSNDPGAIMEDKDAESIILNLVERLPPHYRTVLMLFHVDGLSYEEITQITEMPEGTVKNYIYRARNLLKDIVMKYLGKEELS